MNKKAIIVCPIVIVCILITMQIFSASNKEQKVIKEKIVEKKVTLPDKLVIAECKAKMGQVDFPHQKHVSAAISCTKCHHNHPGLNINSTIEVKTCSSCHNVDIGNTKACSSMSPSNPYHKRCVGCHKDIKKGPEKCKACHGSK